MGAARLADAVLVPAAAVAAAFLLAGLVVLGIGESPLNATRILIEGSLGSGEALGFTLFYATNFVFTGLSVAVAYHAGLFNIGAEGQATLAGLGATLAALNLGPLPGVLAIQLNMMVVMTTWLPRRAWSQPARKAHSAPNSIAAATATGIASTPGSGPRFRAASVAPRPASVACPSAPMLNRPAW